MATRTLPFAARFPVSSLQVLRGTPSSSSGSSVHLRDAPAESWLWAEEVSAVLGASGGYIRDPQNTNSAPTQL